MPNYCPKGTEYMRELARRGGLKSGETRQGKRAMRIIGERAQEKGIPLPSHPIDALVDAGFFPRENRSGGSHDSDWRCPRCHSFNSINSRGCANCKSSAPTNGRLRRVALRERAAEHRTTAILKKHGL
jgi:hypothetical protein